MRSDIFIFALAATLLCSCATEHYITGHGDVGQFILRQAMNFGGSPTTTNGLPAVTSHWSYSMGAEGGFVISMSRDDYSTAELFLSQAFAGQRQFGPKDGEDGFRIFECRLTPKGGGIQLTRHKAEAQVIILPPLPKHVTRCDRLQPAKSSAVVRRPELAFAGELEVSWHEELLAVQEWLRNGGTSVAFVAHRYARLE